MGRVVRFCLSIHMMVTLGLLAAPAAWALEWAERGGGPSGDRGLDVAADASGNSYVIGTFLGTATFGSGGGEVVLNSAGTSSDTFLAKYAPDGVLLWVQQIAGNNVASGVGVAVDDSGNVYAAGAFGSTATLGDGGNEIVLTSAGDFDVFIAKYDGNGTLLWAEQAGGTFREFLGGFDSLGGDRGDGLAVDSEGNAYITGFFTGSATFGSGIDEVMLVGPNNQGDIYLASYAADGSLNWAQRAGSDSFDGGHDLSVDGNGDIHLVARTAGESTFGSGASETTVPSSALSPYVLAEYAADGTLLRAHTLGGDTPFANLTAVAADPAGNSYVGGFFGGFAITLGSGASAVTLPPTANNKDTLFIAKYDAAGDLLWAESTLQSAAIDLATDANGNLWATGSFFGTATFGNDGGVLTLIGSGSGSFAATDAFVLKLDPSGAALQAQKIGNPDNVSRAVGQGIAPGSAVVAGFFSGTVTVEGNAARTLTSAGSGDAFAARFDEPFDLAGLRVEQSVDQSAPQQGDAITFTATVSNDGVNDATQVQITSEVPDGLTDIVATPSQGSYDSATGLWDVGTLPNGSNATLDLTGTTRQASPIESSARVTHSDQADADPANNSAGTQSDPTLPPGSSATVSNTGNDGVGSLRNAIEFANENPNRGAIENIVFNLEPSSDPNCDTGTGVCTIMLDWALAPITEPALIDGLSQAGASCAGWPATLKIHLSGENVDAGHNGLTLSAGNSVVRGLSITGFTSALADTGFFEDIGGAGIFMDSDDNRVECNHLGTDVSGTSSSFVLENEFGVRIVGGNNNTVGGAVVMARNLISNNDQAGISIEGSSASGNVIAGNFVGTDVTGSGSLENGDAGVSIVDAPANVIGGADHDAGVCNKSCNLISGNDDEGVLIEGELADGQIIQGNFIGTDITGATALFNDTDGILIDGGSDGHLIGGLTDPGACSKACNLISGNDDEGIVIDDDESNGIVIQGNFIGTDASGTAAIPNRVGIELDGDGHAIGGTTEGLGNLVSGNESTGIEIDGDGNIVQGNFVGTDITGANDLGNGTDGIEIFGAGHLIGGLATGAGNLIAFNHQSGVEVQGGCCPSPVNNTVSGNSMFLNVGPGIDIGSDGATANDPGDPDTGSNNLQNFPEISSITGDNASTLTIGYAVPSSTANSAYPLRIEFFLADADGAEGRAFIGADTYLNGEAEQQVQVDFMPQVDVQDGKLIVATATDADSNTSEFSAAVASIGSAQPSNDGIFADNFETQPAR